MRLARLAIVFFSALVVTGCPKDWALNLYNNTKVDLVIISPRGSLEWKKGKRIRIVGTATWRRSSLHWQLDEEKDQEVPVLKIRRDGIVLSYKGIDYTNGLGEKYIGYGSPTIEETLQLEEDGRLYILKVGTVPPVRSLPFQPKGFPIEPTNGVTH